MLRQTNVPNIALVQVGAEGNPTETDTLTVSGTLDGNAYLIPPDDGAVSIPENTRAAIAAAEGN